VLARSPARFSLNRRLCDIRQISNLIRLVDHGANLVRLKLTRVDAGDPWGSFWFDADETSPGVARLKDPTLAVCVMGIFKSDSGVTPKKRMI